MSDPAQHRLLAVMVADMVGYSRLMAAHEVETYEELKRIEQAILQPAISSYRGRIVKGTGDGFLAVFASAVDAVRAGIRIQTEMGAGEAAREGDRLRFRIGINVGDVIELPDDVYGHVVNVAARLQTNAEPGSVDMTQSVWEAVRGKIDTAVEDLGPSTLKNMPAPIGIHRIRIGAEPPAAAPARFHLPGWRPLALAASVLVLAGLALFGIERYWQRPMPRAEIATNIVGRVLNQNIVFQPNGRFTSRFAGAGTYRINDGEICFQFEKGGAACDQVVKSLFSARFLTQGRTVPFNTMPMVSKAEIAEHLVGRSINGRLYYRTDGRLLTREGRNVAYRINDNEICYDAEDGTGHCEPVLRVDDRLYMINQKRERIPLNRDEVPWFEGAGK